MKLASSKFHFIGVGGIGMSGLAQLLHNMGAEVSGSDLGENQQTKSLKESGIKIYKGHDRDNIGSADVVVYSSAIGSENVEIIEARKKKIPIIPRAEALAELMRLKRGIAVAGTHGKTTTTSLLSSIFLSANTDPTIVVGGRLQLIQSTASLGQGEWLIAEADESDGSFSKLSPEVVIITNIDNDHLDYFGSRDNLDRAFLSFAGQIPFYGKVIIFGDDPHIRNLFLNFRKPVYFYGFNSDNDYYLRESDGKYTVFGKGLKLGEVKCPLPGRHNALNSLAAMIVGLEAGISFDDCRKGIAEFTGVDRRFELKGEVGDIAVYDDYGHHPTEIKAVLQGFREKYPKGRVVVYFQPHRFSRTQLCWEDFLECFNESDLLFIDDIYPAGEASIQGVSGSELAASIKHKHCKFLPSLEFESTIKEIIKTLNPGDVFVTLGAGTGWKLGLKVLENLAAL